jgi:hypothetical protein
MAQYKGTWSHMYAHVCPYVCVCMCYVCICMCYVCICMYVRIYVCMYVCMYVYTYTQGHPHLPVPPVLFAVHSPPPEIRPLTFLACLRRGKGKKQSNGTISMDRFTLGHQLFLYGCYVKSKSARKCKSKFKR